jgi:hypothetical protein
MYAFTRKLARLLATKIVIEVVATGLPWGDWPWSAYCCLLAMLQHFAYGDRTSLVAAALVIFSGSKLPPLTGQRKTSHSKQELTSGFQDSHHTIVT